MHIRRVIPSYSDRVLYEYVYQIPHTARVWNMLENETGDWKVRVELDGVGEQLLEGLAPELLDGDECTVAQQPEHNVRVVLVNPNESQRTKPH